MEDLTSEELQGGFGSQFANFQRVKSEILDVVKQSGDAEYENELKALFAPFNLQGTEGR